MTLNRFSFEQTKISTNKRLVQCSEFNPSKFTHPHRQIDNSTELPLLIYRAEMRAFPRIARTSPQFSKCGIFFLQKVHGLWNKSFSTSNNARRKSEETQ